MSVFNMTTLRAAGIAPDTPAGAAAAPRAGILTMTQAAEDAVLRPEETGAWPHALRAALAARIASMNGLDALAADYGGADVDLTDPALAPVLAFMDKVAGRTAEVSAQDITDLQAAGVTDADIVRLAELNAFVSYQVRVISGLQLMRETGA